jgi:hypothetical protein
MKTYTGKEIKKQGIWYPVTIQADNLKEANEKVNKANHSGEDLRGRFYEEKHFRGKNK